MSIFFAILLALAVMLLWSGTTLFSFYFTRGKNITLTMGVTLGLWALKFLLLFGAIILLKPYNFFDHTVFAATLGILAFIALGFEVIAIMRRMKKDDLR